MLPTINFHLTKACNYKCGFCYATFDDIREKPLSPAQRKEIIRLLAESGLFRKINFAGGEPFLIQELSELIQFAKERGFETSVVTNGSRISGDRIRFLKGALDILGISVDSLSEETNRKLGRVSKSGERPLDKVMLYELTNACAESGIYLKVNTVVTRYNKDELMADFIAEVRPFRWKIMQVTQILGQNDALYRDFEISDIEFESYCQRNTSVLPEALQKSVIKEPAQIIQGSYLMIDPLGRFYDSFEGKYRYSSPILKVGVWAALQEVWVDAEKFTARGGDYSVRG